MGLILSCLAAASLGQLIQQPGGAVTPVDYANIAATNQHLALRFGHYGYFGKREAEADPQLVHHFNGAVTPFHAANHYATIQHLAAKGYAHGIYKYGKREADADAQYLTSAAYPYAYGYPPYLVAHPNGAVVPLEPADVVKARADHLAAPAAKTIWIDTSYFWVISS